MSEGLLRTRTLRIFRCESVKRRKMSSVESSAAEGDRGESEPRGAAESVLWTCLQTTMRDSMMGRRAVATSLRLDDSTTARQSPRRCHKGPKSKLS